MAEALNNVSRHARASQVVVTMVRKGDEVHVSVEDDGRGLGPGTEGRGTSVRAVLLPAVSL